MFWPVRSFSWRTEDGVEDADILILASCEYNFVRVYGNLVQHPLNYISIFVVEPAPEPARAPRKEVGIADQIAIRSFVLSKSIGKVGGKILDILKNSFGFYFCNVRRLTF